MEQFNIAIGIFIFKKVVYIHNKRRENQSRRLL